ncbi:MAG: leucine-rich repeat domain-containing protein, partial [Ureaplasma sp.]|nr:leucine-rich repeat domain-containing protein [Ureaplasma sp.]
LSNTKITINNLTFYTSISFSNISNAYNAIQGIINENFYSNDNFLVYVSKNKSTLKSTINNNLSKTTSGPGQWSIDYIKNISLDGSKFVITFEPPTNYKFSFLSATNVSVSNNVMTFNNLNYFDVTNTSYFTWSSNTITGLTSLGKELETVVIPNKCTALSNAVFKGNTKIKQVVIPGTINTISNEAFRDCTNLALVKIENGVVNIGSFAFFNTSIVSIDFPQSSRTFNESAFNNCHSLIRVNFYSKSVDLLKWSFSNNNGSNYTHFYFYSPTTENSADWNNMHIDFNTFYGKRNFAYLYFKTHQAANYYKNKSLPSVIGVYKF